jgi:hypothetical protein
MTYPSEIQVELALKRLAADLDDHSSRPFRVDLLKVHGEEAPRYTVVVLSARRNLLYERLGEVLSRSFSLGIRSFLLTALEASKLILKYVHAGHDQAKDCAEHTKP